MQVFLTKFVPNEVEVPLSAEAVDEESDDFVEGDATIDDVVGRVQCRHSRVHFLVHEPEREGLVADQCLVKKWKSFDVSAISSHQNNVGRSNMINKI